MNLFNNFNNKRFLTPKRRDLNPNKTKMNKMNIMELNKINNSNLNDDKVVGNEGKTEGMDNMGNLGLNLSYSDTSRKGSLSQSKRKEKGNVKSSSLVKQVIQPLGPPLGGDLTGIGRLMTKDRATKSASSLKETSVAESGSEEESDADSPPMRWERDEEEQLEFASMELVDNRVFDKWNKFFPMSIGRSISSLSLFERSCLIPEIQGIHYNSNESAKDILIVVDLTRLQIKVLVPIILFLIQNGRRIKVTFNTTTEYGWRLEDDDINLNKSLVISVNPKLLDVYNEI
jgi:hypothetical protein